MVQASLQSIQSGELLLPGVTPALPVNFKALFESPRNPQNVGSVLKYTEECDGDYCYSSTEISTTFLQKYFAGRIDADWGDGDYQWASDEAFGDAVEEIGNSVSKYTTLGD
jgi:hypothetical protein